MPNNHLNNAFLAEDDEFYTQYADIEKLMLAQLPKFENKVIYCNCDNYKVSNFYKFFKSNFQKLKLKKLIASEYVCQQMTLFGQMPRKAILASYDGDTEQLIELSGNGSFDCVELQASLKESDIVITNPPFSLKGEFVDYLRIYKKKFILIMPVTCVTHSKLFNVFKDSGVKVIDYNKFNVQYFLTPSGKKKRVTSYWITNLKCNNSPLEVKALYKDNKYKICKVINLPIINTLDTFPSDYNGEMLVPITIIQYMPDPRVQLLSWDDPTTFDNKNVFKRLRINFTPAI